MQNTILPFKMTIKAEPFYNIACIVRFGVGGKPYRGIRKSEV